MEGGQCKGLHILKTEKEDPLETYLINIRVIGIVVAVEHGSSTIVCVIIIVLGSVHILQIVCYARMACVEGRKGSVPPIKRLVQRVTAEVVVVVPTAAAIVDEEVAQNILNRNGRIVAAILFRTGCVCIETNPNVATHHRFDVIVDIDTAISSGVRIDAALWPGLSGILHKGILLVGPDANSFMLEKLLHPVIVRLVLEESQQRKVSVFQVTVHLGTSRAPAVVTGRRVPFVVETIPVLVLSNASSFVAHVDVLQAQGIEMREKTLVSGTQKQNPVQHCHPQTT